MYVIAIMIEAYKIYGSFKVLDVMI